MGEIQLDEQSGPVTPAAGKGFLFFDSSGSMFLQKNDAGVYQGDHARAAVASQGAGFATDTYVTNSGLILPSFSMQAGMVFKWELAVSKTAAGVATPIYQVRIGAAQTTADTSRLSMTGPAQTAVVDEGILSIMVTCRNVGAAAILQGIASWEHEAAVAAGFGGNVQATSAGFDNTALGGQFVGLSINGGASAAWTVAQVLGRWWLA
jgi:hypothetical protein